MDVKTLGEELELYVAQWMKLPDTTPDDGEGWAMQIRTLSQAILALEAVKRMDGRELRFYGKRPSDLNDLDLRNVISWAESRLKTSARVS